MKLVLYKTSDYTVKLIHSNIASFSFFESEDKYLWFDVKGEENSIEGVDYEKFNCILLDDSANVDNEVTNEIISQDKKLQFVKLTLEQENKDLKKQLTDITFELMMKGVL